MQDSWDSSKGSCPLGLDFHPYGLLKLIFLLKGLISEDSHIGVKSSVSNFGEVMIQPITV